MVSIDIEDKIYDLFELRLIPELIQWGSGHDLNKRFLKDLFLLQNDIYLLDKTLEESWDVDEHSMDHYWNLVTCRLSDFGYSSDKIGRLLYRLKVYVENELIIRKRIFPSFQQIRPFYYFKSCDVKLARDLIYDRYPVLESVLPKVAWILFDLITEVNDDISDELEDRQVYNGNRFLFSLYTHGVEDTLYEYTMFMEEISIGMKRYASRIPSIIRDKTRQEYDKVLNLLEQYEFDPKPKFIMHSYLVV